MTRSEPGSGRQMLRGSFWMIALRWSVRLTGVVSTVILARLLQPSDFGVVAIAMLVVGALEVFGQTGQRLALIRHAAPTRAHYDTAWTLSVLVGLAVAACILVIAPFTRVYFHEPRSVLVMQCLAARAALGGFENIGVVDFRRELQFHRFFLINLYGKLAAFVVTITLAVALRNYWALVGGILTGQIAANLLSFTMHPYRPRFSLAKIGETWSFSIWTLLRTLGLYCTGQLDQFAVGGFAGAASMGRYAVAADIATSPTTEVNDPMIAVLYPVMSKVRHDPEKLRALYVRVLGWSAIICAATSVGVTLVAEDYVHLVLGSKWLDVQPLMGWLAISAGLLSLSSGADTTFDSLGLPRMSARLQWLRFALLALCLFPIAFLRQNIEAVAMARLAVTAVFIPLLFLSVGRIAGVSAGDYIRALWRPILAAGCMALAVIVVNRGLGFSGLPRLLIDMALGAGVYGGVLLSLWTMSGRPPTPESDVVDFLGAFLRKYRRRGMAA